MDYAVPQLNSLAVNLSVYKNATDVFEVPKVFANTPVIIHIDTGL